MTKLHDGDLFQIAPHPNPVYAEFLNTNGRLGWRLSDKYGAGILLEREAMEKFSILLDISLGKKTVPSLVDFDKELRSQSDVSPSTP